MIPTRPRSAMVCGLLFGAMLASANVSVGCTKQQGTVLLSGLPADAALVGCVLSEALSGGLTVAALAGSCLTDAETVAMILYNAATLPPGNATPAMLKAATTVRSTPSFADAFHHYPEAARNLSSVPVPR